MEDLIKSLQIFLKYQNDDFPTFCENGKLYVKGCDIEKMDDKDISDLRDFGWRYDEFWHSYRFGEI